MLKTNFPARGTAPIHSDLFLTARMFGVPEFDLKGAN